MRNKSEGLRSDTYEQSVSIPGTSVKPNSPVLTRNISPGILGKTHTTLIRPLVYSIERILL